MITAPYYPIQSSVPAGAQFKTFADGSRGFELFSYNNDSIALLPRTCLPKGSLSYMASLEVQSTLDSNANGYAGIGFDLLGIKRDGTSRTARKLTADDILNAGERRFWHNEKHDDWYRINIISQPEERLGFTDIVPRWIVRGNGSVKIRAMELRNHYTRRYSTSIGPNSYGGPVGSAGGFQFQRAYGLYQGVPFSDIYTRFLATYATRINRGQVIRVNANAFINEAAVRGQTGQVANYYSVAIALKLYGTDGNADWWTSLTSTYLTGDRVIRNEAFGRSESFIAERSYYQIEPIINFYTTMDSGDVGIVSLDHEGFEIEIMIDDSVASDTGG